MVFAVTQEWNDTQCFLLPCCAPQKGITVINSARQDSVTGTLVGSTGSGAAGGSVGGNFDIIAFPETTLRADGTSSNPTGASKLRVGPSCLAAAYRGGFRNLFGPYWIVDAGAHVQAKGIYCGSMAQCALLACSGTLRHGFRAGMDLILLTHTHPTFLGYMLSLCPHWECQCCWYSVRPVLSCLCPCRSLC